MQRQDHYPREPPPLPQYDISPELKKLVLIMGIAQFILAYNFTTILRRKPRQDETLEYEKLHSQPSGEGITYT